MAPLISRLALVAIAVASVGFPGLLIWQHLHGGGAACDSDGADSAAALRALAELAERNAEALHELRTTSDPLDRAMLATLDNALARRARTGPEKLQAAPLPQLQPEAPLAPRAAATAAAAARPPVWLRLALLSVARPGADYLLRSLRSIVEQIPSSPGHPLAAAVDVVAVNNNQPPEAHTVFARAESMYAGHVRFVTKRAHDPPLSCPAKAATKVKASVQRQSCDIAAAIASILQVSPPPAHVMLLEDDWLFCPHGMTAAMHAMDTAYSYDPRWIALRVSYVEITVYL
jgi:hypothetical protein